MNNPTIDSKTSPTDKVVSVGLPQAAIEAIKSMSDETFQAILSNATTFILLKSNDPALTSGHRSMTSPNAADMPSTAR